MNEQTANTRLVILCGGRSVRLGTDKGLFKPLGDESLVRRAVRLFGSSFSEITFVVKDSEQAELYRAELRAARYAGRVVADLSPVPAALSGIVGALADLKAQSNGIEQLIALPIDQVGVRGRHLEDLIKAAAGCSAPAAAYLDSAVNDILPFPSIWHVSALNRLQALIEGRSLSVKSALAHLYAWVIPDLANIKQLRANCNTVEDFKSYFGSPLTDPYGRRLHYLRFSLTEACNLSCAYCLPDGFPEWYRHKAHLKIDAVTRILSGFRQLGFRKVRFTGGEPTVHPHCQEAIRIAAEMGFEDIALSTNGLLIKDLIAWRNAGLTRINFSLDTLNPEEFFKLARNRDVNKITNAIESAVAAGIDTRVNTVLLRSINLNSVEALIDWALSKPIRLRFIELMPTHLNMKFSDQERVPNTEILPLLTQRGLVPAAKESTAFAVTLGGPATYWENGPNTNYRGKIGLISPLSANFCDTCNRLRVSARGALRLCLFGNGEAPLDLDSPESVAISVRAAIEKKPLKHSLEKHDVGNVSTFRNIGG